MPNGELTEKEAKEYNKPLKKVKDIFIEFAKKYKFSFDHTIYHECPTIGLSFGIKSKKSKEYSLSKAISLSFEEKKESSAIFKFWIVVTNTYNIFNELLTIIPAYDKKFSVSHKRLKWERTLGYLEAPIDKEKLKSLLTQAKQILDNFDESQLQEVK